MNSVQLIGNLASDVDLRELGEERKVASFLLAVDRPGPDKKADFVRVSAWNRQAEVCSQFLTKGKRVGVDGRLRSSSWEDAEGKRRSAVEVVATQVQFLSPRKGPRATRIFRSKPRQLRALTQQPPTALSLPHDSRRSAGPLIAGPALIGLLARRRKRAGGLFHARERL